MKRYSLGSISLGSAAVSVITATVALLITLFFGGDQQNLNETFVLETKELSVMDISVSPWDQAESEMFKDVEQPAFENIVKEEEFLIDNDPDLACLTDSDCDDSNVCTDDTCVLGPEITEDVSIPVETYCGSVQTYGNVFEVDSTVMMTAYAQKLYMACGTNLTLVVYEGATLTGTYNRIYEETQYFSGHSGGYYYLFDDLEIPLREGKFYAVGLSWSLRCCGICAYAGWTTTSDPQTFGLRVGSINTSFYNAFSFDGSSLPATEGFAAEITFIPEGVCSYTNNTDPCRDGVDCTLYDVCLDGVCSGTPSNEYCDNEVYCDGVETCDPINDCQDGTPVDCNDSVDCTVDSCNEQLQQCDNIPNDYYCDNGLACDGVETCDPVSGCQAGTPVDCNDGIDCTIDACHESPADVSSYYCSHTPDDSYCDDDLWCNGEEICEVPEKGMKGGKATGCITINVPNCDDQVSCTDDSCNEQTDQCDNTPNDANCDDSLWCNGVETCDVELDCQDGTPVDCNDGVRCTNDSCNEGSDQCENEPDDSNCNDGVSCTDDTCDAVNDCQYTPNDANCDDSLWCNGVETCDAQLDCQDGTPVDCNDSVGCTNDSCNEASDQCENIPDDANCDDSLWCNGTETCDVELDCQAGTPVDCNDDVNCTNDSCDETSDQCINTPDDSYCDDGVMCTDDTCDVVYDCRHTPNNANCDDGLWCNGMETCDAELDCRDGIPVMCLTDDLFCNGVEFCDEENDECASTGYPCEANEVCNEETDSCDIVGPLDDDDDDDDNDDDNDDDTDGADDDEEVGVYGAGRCGC